MNAGAHDLQGSNEVLGGGVDQKVSEKSRNSVVWSVVETVIVIESEEGACVIGKNEDLEALGDELGSDKPVAEGIEKLNDKEACDQRGCGEVPSQVEQGTNRNSKNLVDETLSETVVVINSDEAVRVVGDNGRLVAKVDELGSSKVLVEESKKKAPQAEKDSYVIDMKKCGSGKGFGDKWDGERVCRICHISSDQTPDRKMGTTSSITMDLIHLGCGCKDELGVAHDHCAEAWFKLKGNRMCEICGETAQNVTGHGDGRFMEEWNEAALSAIGNNSPESNGGCWRGQPFCNFLMACLVIAFVLPWFFRANMF